MSIKRRHTHMWYILIHNHTVTQSNSKEDQRGGYTLCHLVQPIKLTSRWKWQYCHSNKDWVCNTTACACLCVCGMCVCVLYCVWGKKTRKTQHRGPCQILKEETAASYSAKLRRECLERRCTFKRDKQESSSRSWQGTEAWKEGNKGIRRKDRWTLYCTQRNV